EALRGPAEQQRRGGNRPGDHHDADDHHAHQTAHHPYIAVAGAVDRPQHVAHRTARPLAVLEQHPAKRRTKGRALTARASMATETATANWRKSCPLMPGMKATRTNTDKRTSVMAIIGPVISAMAFLQASGTGRSGFSSITRSTFSTTTMASSTTIPMASTS